MAQHLKCVMRSISNLTAEPPSRKVLVGFAERFVVGHCDHFDLDPARQPR